jgi:hypothetical protein
MSKPDAIGYIHVHNAIVKHIARDSISTAAIVAELNDIDLKQFIKDHHEELVIARLKNDS